jgi:hypothetical protein
MEVLQRSHDNAQRLAPHRSWLDRAGRRCVHPIFTRRKRPSQRRVPLRSVLPELSLQRVGAAGVDLCELFGLEPAGVHTQLGDRAVELRIAEV